MPQTNEQICSINGPYLQKHLFSTNGQNGSKKEHIRPDTKITKITFMLRIRIDIVHYGQFKPKLYSTEHAYKLLPKSASNNPSL